MIRILQFLIFISIFILIYGGMNYYVLSRLTTLLGFKKNILFYLTVLIVSLAYPFFSFLEKRFLNFATKGLYFIASLWMGIAFLFLCILIIHELIGLFAKLNPFYSAISIIVIVAILTIFSIINALSVSVQEVNLISDNTSNNISENITFVQWSDVHLGSVRNSDFLTILVDKTNKINPDFVVITGDLIDGTAHLSNNMLKKVDELNAPVYFVTGNHETYEDSDKISTIINQTKIISLNDEQKTIKGVNLIGFSYEQDKTKFINKLSRFKQIKEDFSILLNHAPMNPSLANQYGFDLVLSGHTHNGQIFPFNLIVKLFFPTVNGLYRYKDTILYVSPGTGTWGPYMRLGSKNEITVFNLIKE
ncbi:metallophosphoesterase [Candidatus Woesearchaeota archaeon]|nr:metallophosphoesterase [Candidatus Woesearchaeota archaeon]MBT6518892.1 metallophosphoesterase [Candidatus Woesearchaeota archaeon]MBT7368494.1 metallophosphoesterase [Candidatus Woesearchaeota archaeon]